MQHDTHLKQNARLLRRGLSPAESILWKALRGRQFAGFKFRRQQPLGAYVVDFYCPAVKLVLEIDGETHLGRENVDHERDRWLDRQGILVVRFWNTQVFDELDALLEAIWQECDRRRKDDR